MTGLLWVVDGYTLMFAALLLFAGTLSDRIGARQAFGVGLVLFVAASAACGLSPTLGVLVASRLAQGAGDDATRRREAPSRCGPSAARWPRRPGRLWAAS
jgi:sugar phosphate permease